MSEAGHELFSQLAYNLYAQPKDIEEQMVEGWRFNTKGTIMPPSPGVRGLEFNCVYEDGVLKYDLDVDWRPATHWLVRNIPKEQAFHRSRMGVVALRELQIHENATRNERVREWLNTGKFDIVERHRQKMSEIYQVVTSRTLDYIEFDEDWISTYVRKHAGSSIGAGLKWRDLASMDRSEWHQFFDVITGLAERIHDNPGWWLNLDYRTGLRARSDSLSSFSPEYTGEIDRTRVVMFHPVISPWFVFMPNKRELFAHIFRDVLDILGLSNQVFLPFVEGGRIYSVASELFNQFGRQFSAQDGKSWEASVGAILGPDFAPFYSRVGGIDLLASGEWATSLLGSIASAVMLTVQPADTVAILLGDDQNLFGRHKKPIVPWIEEDPGDTREQVILGLGYRQNPDMPRVYGLKTQSDRADKALPLNLEEGVEESVTMSGRHNDRERAAHTGAYLGYFGGASLIERLRKVDLTRLDYISPGEVLQGVTSLEDDRDVDTFEWTESFGADARRQIAHH